MAILLYQWLLLLSSFFFSHPSINNISGIPHPFFVSVTEINHNAADKNLEISCKIFTDDLESTLTKNYKVTVDLYKPRQKETDSLIASYIRKHLSIQLDGRPVTLEFVGYERENEVVWSYFQVPKTSAPKRVAIVNSILYDAFTDEINLMHVEVGGTRKSTKLNYPDTNASFEF